MDNDFFTKFLPLLDPEDPVDRSVGREIATRLFWGFAFVLAVGAWLIVWVLAGAKIISGG